MRFVMFFWCMSFLVPPVSGTAAEAGGRPNTAYQIPQTVFVGDPGRLVLPLKTLPGGTGGAVLDNPEELPGAPDLVISRVELENRGGNYRLIVDFKAFTPGLIILPPVEIASLIFTDLEVTVASILEAGGNALVLSEPAPHLVVPGTMGMIYAAAFGMAVFIAGVVLLMFKGGPAFRRWRERLRRRYVIRSMGKVLRYLRNTLEKGGPEKASGILDRLSSEFKTFLGFFTGMNCLAMTGEEFLFLPALTPDPSGPFLRDFFRRCDILRFSGVEIQNRDVFVLLDLARDFTVKMISRKPPDFGGDTDSVRVAGGEAGSGRQKPGHETGRAV
jgi:hypothetical protein